MRILMNSIFKMRFWIADKRKDLVNLLYKVFYICAQDWNRTSTPVKAADFESAASTNSATWAGSVLRAAMLQHSVQLQTGCFQIILKFYLQQFFLGRKTDRTIRSTTFIKFIQQSSFFHTNFSGAWFNN